MKPTVAVIDIDGTISNCRWRSQFLPPRHSPDFDNDRTPGWNNYHEKAKYDKPIQAMVNILDNLKNDMFIVLLTARPIVRKQETEEWLKENSISYNVLWMKAETHPNYPPDFKAIACEEIENLYGAIAFVLDDDPGVVSKLGGLGYNVLQVKNIESGKLEYFEDALMDKRKVFVTITGPTCSGKTTFLKELMRQSNKYVELLSTTTRPPRSGELEGSHYFFVTEEEFNSQPMVEEIVFAGYKYGLSEKELEAKIANGKLPINIVEPRGASQIAKYCHNHGYKHIKLFISTSPTLTMTRLLEREKQDILESLASSIKPPIDKVLQTYSERIIAHSEVESGWESSLPWNYVVRNYEDSNHETAVTDFLSFVDKLLS